MSNIETISTACDTLIDQSTAAVVLATINDKQLISFKGTSVDISTMLNTVLVNTKEEQPRELAKILIATPFVSCELCEDETRKKEIFSMIDSLYQELYLNIQNNYEQLLF